MATVVSPDGASISYRKSGKGPPLVLVHGTTTDHTVWSAAAPYLAERHTLYAVDRRGRRGSTEGLRWSLEAERQDLVAVLDEIGEPVSLLGHSFGALCSLEAARVKGVRNLVLYEPPISKGPSPVPKDLVRRFEQMLERGDREGVVTAFFRDIERVSPAEMAKLVSLPSWGPRVEAAHTVAREVGAVLDYQFDAERFSAMGARTLMLLGGESPPFLAQSTHMIDDALPDSRVEVLPGQKHSAMVSTPERFAQAVLGFLGPDHR